MTSPLGRPVRFQMRTIVKDKVDISITSQVDSFVWDQVWNQVRTEVKRQVRFQLFRQVIDATVLRKANASHAK